MKTNLADQTCELLKRLRNYNMLHNTATHSSPVNPLTPSGATWVQL